MRPCSDFMDMLRRLISCRIIIIIIIIIIFFFYLLLLLLLLLNATCNSWKNKYLLLVFPTVTYCVCLGFSNFMKCSMKCKNAERGSPFDQRDREGLDITTLLPCYVSKIKTTPLCHDQAVF